VLTLYRAEANAFSNDNLRLLLSINSKAALTIENALQFRQAQNTASTDELTGLPNARALFLELDKELARCKRTGEPLAVLVLDLDGFKQVNDRFGHLEGNRTLKHVAMALRTACREYDFVARMGGDEFVVILPGISRGGLNAKAAAICEMVEAVGRQVLDDGILGLSVGEAWFGEDGTDVEQLLSKADQRMYQVKQKHHLRVPVEALTLTGLGCADERAGDTAWSTW
jgi:diguanylate cyclase (GGDEF)-like protein